MAESISKLKDVVKKTTGDSTAQEKGINGGDSHGKSKSKRNYKLLIDPAIKKGHQKIYRFDGILSGKPSIIPQDPRPLRTKLWTTTVAELPIPRFKVDKYYVGNLPENTIRFGCLNDNINRQFLRELCSKFGKIEECKVYYDIKSKKHLGTGKITFSTSTAARQAVSELDGSSVMGNIIRVSIERKKNRNRVSESGHSSKDPREFRDPRRSISGGSNAGAVLPTPSPSQYSPSVESTPPTPLVSAMNRSHPVALMKHGQYQRRGDSFDNDITPLESPASICSASFNSTTFEPISPPAVTRMRSLSSDNSNFPPPPPPDKTSHLPPPPPPAKQEIYEDISPTANFDDESKSPVGEQGRKDRTVNIIERKETLVQAHLLGLKIACGGENTRGGGRKGMMSYNADGSKNHEMKHRLHSSRSPNNETSKATYNKERESSSRSERLDIKSESTSNYTKSFRKEQGVNYEASKSKTKLTERRLQADLQIDQDVGRNSSVFYEAISDSDDEGNPHKPSINTSKNLQVEDISPVNSPVCKSSFNGLGVVKAEEVAVSKTQGTVNEKDQLNANNCEMDVNDNGDENVNDDGDDDEDDAMSLSSISSNEESSLVLNTPAVPVANVSSSSAFPSFPNQPTAFVHSRPNLTIHPGHPSNIVAPPPVNIAAPPHVAPPSQINMQPVNVHQRPPQPPPQPPVNVQQPPVIGRLPPPPPVNIHIPPPRIPFNQNIPPLPYRPRAGQPPQMRAAQAPPSYPPNSAGGGFLGSFSGPYPGFFSGNYQNYRDFNTNEGRQVAAVVKEIPYEEKVKTSCTMKTRKELKAVLRRDLIKRLVEHSGFSALEAWWDNQTKKKDSAATVSRPTTIPHSNTAPLSISHNESPSSSTTSSLLMSLFGRAHASSSSASSSHFSSPTRIHGPVSKIPSFRINRIPQARPIGREAVNRKLKRDGKTNGTEVANKLQRLSPEEDEAERTVKEEESDSESDSEDDRRLLPSRRQTVQSGSSLYQRIYETSESEESDEDQKWDEEGGFQELIHQQQKLKKEQMQKIKEEKQIAFKDKEDAEEDEEDEEMSIEDEEEEDEERSSDEDEEEERDDDDDDDDDDDEEDDDDDEQEEESDSEGEFSGAEQAVEEVIKETERRLEQFKEKTLKKEEKKRKKIEHETLVRQYLKRVGEEDLKDEREAMDNEILSNNEKNSLIYENKVEKESVEVNLNIKGNLDEISKKLEEAKILSSEKEDKLKVNETLNKVVEETIEETEILSKVTELDGSEVKEELISEEVIKIEPEGEVLNEHSYAFTSSYDVEEDESTEMKEGSAVQLKEKSPSPIIDVVDINDEKELLPKVVEPKAVFPMRSIDHDNAIVWNILREGIDTEDLKYLQTAFESLHVFGSDVVKDHHWSHHPETFLQTKQKKSRGESMLKMHNTGCARSEGYYKIPLSEKSQYLSSVMRQLETKDESNEKESDGLKHKQQSRENRAIQRRLVSSFVNDDFGDLVKFNKLKSRKKKLKFAKSGIHNWGLFTCEPIAAEEMVIEYVGEIVRSVIADAREKHYEKTGIGSSYLFRLDAETVIDATKVGNNARFINHSCAPNCYAKIINVENEKKIVIYSKFDIKMNDEITYDYKFPIEEVKIQCLCGTPQCRGTLN